MRKFTTSSEMPPIIHVTLPYPPSTNHFYAVFRGRKITSAAGRKWIDAAVTSIREQAGGQFTGAVRVTGTIYRPLKSGDLSNRIKPVEDVLQKAGLLKNDNQIDELEWFKRDDKTNPRVEVTITKLDPQRPGV